METRTTQSVNLVRDAAEPGGRDLFSCAPHEWALLIELAQTFGWHAHGATYVQPAGAPRENAALHSYEAGEQRDPKHVDNEDALNWAAALDRARHSPHLGTLIESLDANASKSGKTRSLHFIAVLEDFIVYAYGGGFSFAAAA